MGVVGWVISATESESEEAERNCVFFYLSLINRTDEVNKLFIIWPFSAINVKKRKTPEIIEPATI